MASIQKVDTKAPYAQASDTSMDDNNCGRVIYVLKDEDLFVARGRYVINIDNRKRNLELKVNSSI